MSIFPRSPIPAQDIMVCDLIASPDPVRLAVYSVQGLINRKQPRIFVIDRNFSHREELDSVKNRYDFNEDNCFWYHTLIEPSFRVTLIPPLALLQQFATVIHKGVFYDPTSVSNINVAATLAGVEDRILLTPELADSLKINDLVDLRGRFRTELDAYRWACHHLLRKCSQKTIASNPSHYYDLFDYLIAHKIFIFHFTNRAMYEAGREIYEQIFNHSEPVTPVMGVWLLKEWHQQKSEADEEVDMVKLVSQYGKFFVVSYECSNLSFHSGCRYQAPLNRKTPPDWKTPPAAQLGKYHGLALIVSEGDNINYQMYAQPKQWQSPVRSRIPIGWEFNPLMSELIPDILCYYLNSASPYDEPLIATSGLGHLLINNFGAFFPLEKRQALLEQYFALLADYTGQMGWNSIRVHDIGINRDPDSLPYASIQQVNRDLLRYYSRLVQASEGAVFCDYFARNDLTGSNSAYLLDGVPVFHNIALTNVGNPEDYAAQLKLFFTQSDRSGLFFGMVNGWQMRLNWLEKVLAILADKCQPLLPQQLNQRYRLRR